MVNSLLRCCYLYTTTSSVLAFTNNLPSRIHQCHHSHGYHSTWQSLSINDDTISNDSNIIDLCIIGGGMSGLSAAIKAASSSSSSVLVLERQSQPGGRVSSKEMEGYTFDRGYAVFITDYPKSKELFDYDQLQLEPYDPGALIRLSTGKFAPIADPLRQPNKIWDTLTTSVGTWRDKVRLMPLFLTLKTNSIEQLFQQPEMNTYACLKEKYQFSDKIIQEFFTPFLMGIYFAPLEEQSSRMFHFVLKMFLEGSATLPKGGMQAVAHQLLEKATNLGVTVHLQKTVTKLKKRENDGLFEISTASKEESSRSTLFARSVICATEVPTAWRLLSSDGNVIRSTTQEKGLLIPPQRSVGCLYYTFPECHCPITEKLLILNGQGGPALTVSFLHLIQPSYARTGYGLCSVSIPERYMQEYQGLDEQLEARIRQQLVEWWPECPIRKEWKWMPQEIYHIQNAQPAQYNNKNGSHFLPANVPGGRDPSKMFHDVTLPTGLYAAGDYMATATLNGALESGTNAAQAAIKYLNKKYKKQEHK